jgi:hypothetical protein
MITFTTTYIYIQLMNIIDNKGYKLAMNAFRKYFCYSGISTFIYVSYFTIKVRLSQVSTRRNFFKDFESGGFIIQI